MRRRNRQLTDPAGYGAIGPSPPRTRNPTTGRCTRRLQHRMRARSRAPPPPSPRNRLRRRAVQERADGALSKHARRGGGRLDARRGGARGEGVRPRVPLAVRRVRGGDGPCPGTHGCAGRRGRGGGLVGDGRWRVGRGGRRGVGARG
ncbi:hypothetical protein T484DRAFT_1895181, partial [Baffinella frigidus]